MAAGRAVCWRCGEPIGRSDEWDLGHRDDGAFAGPEHRRQCNRRAAALKGHGKKWTAAVAPPGADLVRVRTDSQRRADQAEERRSRRMEERGA